MDESRLEAIRKNSQLVIATLGVACKNFGLNRESVAWIEGFMERQRAGADSESLASTVACFLSEAIIAAAGGQWADGRKAASATLAMAFWGSTIRLWRWRRDASSPRRPP